MRISDWSSDVCSSDLRKGFGNLGPCYTAASDDDFLTARGRLRFGRSFSSRSLFLRRRVLRNDHSNQRCGGENLLPVAKICAVRHTMSTVFDRLAGNPPGGEWLFPPSRLALTQVIETSPYTFKHKITTH